MSEPKISRRPLFTNGYVLVDSAVFAGNFATPNELALTPRRVDLADGVVSSPTAEGTATPHFSSPRPIAHTPRRPRNGVVTVGLAVGRTPLVVPKVNVPTIPLGPIATLPPLLLQLLYPVQRSVPQFGLVNHHRSAKLVLQYGPNLTKFGS